MSVTVNESNYTVSINQTTQTVQIASPGPAGQGVPVGGSAGQVLSKIDGTNYRTQWSSAGSGTVTSVTLQGDNGSGATINTSGNIKVAATAPISTTVSGDTVTVTHDGASGSGTSTNYPGAITVNATGHVTGVGSTATPVLPTNNLSDLSNAGTAQTNLGGTTVGKAVFTAADAAAARTAIGVGTGSGDVVAANNLSDLANAGTARTNLGLGTAAVVDTGTGNTNAILGNDTRLTDARTPTTTLDHDADKITSGTLTVVRGGTGSATAPMVGVVTAADAAAARTVLGLGTVATTAATAYATAAQGTKADSALQDVVSDTSPQLGGNLDVQASTLTTSTSNGNIVVDPPGTGYLQVEGTTNPGKIRLMCEAGTHGVGLISPTHANSTNATDYDLTLPIETGAANKALIATDSSGTLGWSSALGTAAAAATGDFAAAAHTHTVSQISDLSDPVTSPAMTGVSAGSITGVIKCSQSQYDAITPNANTLYVIV